MARNLKVEARLIADTGAYTAGIRKAMADTDRFGKSTKRAGRGDPFAGLAKNALKAAAATASLYTAYDQGKKAVNTTLDLAKSTRQLTRTTGLSTQEASRFVAVAKVRGIENTKLAASFTILSKQIVAAQGGSEKAVDTFNKLGVSQEAIRKGNTRQVFLDAADGLSKMENNANKTAYAAQLFGRGYQALFPLLDMGSKGIAEQLQLAGDLGAELGGKGQDSVLKFAEAQRKAKLAQMGLQVQLGQVLIPLLTEGVAALSDFIAEFRNGEGAGGKFKSTLEDIKGVLEPIAKLLKDQPGLLAGAVAAYVGLKGTIAGLNLYNALMTALGPIPLYQAAGAVRGAAFGAAFGRAVPIGVGIGLVSLPVIVATALDRVGAVFQQWATRNMGPELRRLLGVPLTLNPLESFKPWFEQLKVNAKATWDFIKRIFSSNPLAANPFGRMSQWWDTIKKGAKGAWDFIKRLFGGGGSSNLLGTIRAPKIEGLDRIASSVRGAINTALRVVASFAARFLAAGKKVIDNLADGVKSAAGKVISAASSVVSKALSAARGLIPGFQSVGASISQGLAAGISSAVGSVVNAARNAVKQAQDAARSQAKSKSPSLVFAAIGEDLVAGMALGMSRVAPVTRAARNIVRAAASSTAPKTGVPLSGFLSDPITDGAGLDPQLVQQQQRLAQAEAAVEKAKTAAGDKRSKAESRRIRALQQEVRNAQNAVGSLERQISRRDVLIGIRDQFKGFVDQAVQNFRDGLKRAAEGDLQRSLANLDEATGNSPQAQRLRALRAEQDRLAREREDSTYNTTRADLEAQLAKAVANGNVRAQTELNAQLAQLDQDRRDTERQREIDSLSTSLQAQRDNAQAIYDERVAAADAANNADVLGFQAALQAKLDAERLNLEARTADYATFARNVSAILDQYGLSGIFSASTSDEGALQSPVSLPKKKKTKKPKKRASGGMLSRTALTLVGETGPELIMGGNVMSATRTARTGGAGVTLNVYPRTTADDPVALARALGWQLATR